MGGNDVSGPGIKIDIMGEKSNEDSGNVKPRAKEAPIWITQSTVLPVSGAQSETVTSEQTHPSELQNRKRIGSGKDDEILAELLVHESKNKKPRVDINEALGEGGDDDSDSGSDESDFETPIPGPATKESGVTESMEIHSESDQEDEEVHEIKIGNKMVPVNDVTEEMLKQMTPEEHEAYTKTLQHVYSQLY